jgi:flagellar motor switch protein FliN/FliY
MTPEEALVQLAESTADAVDGVLQMFAPGQIERGPAGVVAAGQSPFSMIAAPAVATNVTYAGGVTGGNVFVIALAGARKLAAAMMGVELSTDEGDELSELELSAVGEAANQMMAAAAAATSQVLGEEVEIAAPETRFLPTAEAADASFPHTAHAVAVSFKVLDEPCRLVQLVPNAFVVRMTRALAERGAESAPAAGHGGVSADAPSDSIRDVPVRIWAELGRTRLPFGQLVGLSNGAVVELEEGADDLVGVYVNGRSYATGRLLVVDGDWAVRIEAVHQPSEAVAATTEGGTT